MEEKLASRLADARAMRYDRFMTRAESRPVVFINGLGAPRIAAKAYAGWFRRQGLTVATVPQPLLLYEDIRVSASRVGKTVAQVIARTGADKVHLVGMSLGGLIGLYYVKCAGGAARVDRFVSVGGPLDGVELLDLVAHKCPFNRIQSLSQTAHGSDLLREIRHAPPPPGVRIWSVGGPHDLLVARSCWDVDGVTPVYTNHGVFPFGHYVLFFHPQNRKLVFDLLTRPSARASTR